MKSHLGWTKNLIVHSHSGMTLIEVTTASSIAMILLYGMLSLAVVVQNQVQETTILRVRDKIQRDLARAASSPQAIALSRAKDNVLNSCFLSGYQSLCPAQTIVDISLYDEAGDQVGGPSTAPIYYTSAGDKCAAPSVACVIQVTTSLRAQMSTNIMDRRLYANSEWAKSWLGYEVLEIRYSIVVASNVSGGLSKRNIGGSYYFDRIDLPGLP
jgi:hypothetical protein